MMRSKIIFEDKYILVINKPTGMVVNRSETVKRETVQDWMEKKFSIFNFQFSKTENESDFIKRSGLVHRLDKDTSGVMVLAKTPQSFEKLKDQFKRRKVEKEYIVLVHGKIVPKKGNINLPIARNPKNRMRFTVRVGGRDALTFYEVEKYLVVKTFSRVCPWTDPAKPVFSLIRVRPRTGRTHQIRVHFSFIGYPIVSDRLYLSRKKLESDLAWCPRLFLHARRLSFSHPKTGKRLVFEVRLPRDLERAIGRIGQIGQIEQ